MLSEEENDTIHADKTATQDGVTAFTTKVLEDTRELARQFDKVAGKLTDITTAGQINVEKKSNKE